MQKHICVTLELQTITCPGVWLCPHGPVEATVKCLGYNHITHQVEPKFPISIHKTFKMESTFNAATIDDLHKKLAMEPIEISLWQRGQRLAHYAGTLPNLLSRHNSTMVQLLMACSRSLGGAIAPRVQLSAKIENVQKCYRCNSTVLSPMVLRAQTFAETVDHLHRIIPRKFRQSPVCHAPARICTARTEYTRVFQRESPRDPTYRGNVYCHGCRDTLTPTQNQQGTNRWESRSNAIEQSACSHRLNSSESQHDFCDFSSSMQAIHSPQCRICAKYRETFNIAVS